MAVNEARENHLALKVVWTEDWRGACPVKMGKTVITQVGKAQSSLSAGWMS